MIEFLVTLTARLAAGDLTHIEATANEMHCSIEDRISDLLSMAIQLESAGEAVSHRALTVDGSQLPFDPDPIKIEIPL
jgi:hypothetical protein